MYEAFMGLNLRPFNTSPDVNMYVPTDEHEKTLRQLVLGVNANHGMTILTGEGGTGKTLLAQKLVQRLRNNTIPLSFPNANFSTRRAFYQSMLFELRQPYSGLGLQELRLQMTSVVRQMAPKHRPILLVIDEAHLLSDRILEEVRNCMNIIVEGESVFRTLLVGSPELEERLAHPDLSEVNNRVGMHSMSESLNKLQSIHYIEQRLLLAQTDTGTIFEYDALTAIAEASGGIPKAINQLADHALTVAVERGVRPVTVEVVLEALADLQHLPIHWNTPAASLDSLSENAEQQEAQSGFEQFEWNESPESSASIEVGSAWDDEATVVDAQEEDPLEVAGEGDASSVIELGEELNLEEGIEDEHDEAPFGQGSLEHEIDPDIEAALSQLSEADVQSEILAEVSLLNDVLNVQLKDEGEETAQENRLIPSSADESVESETQLELVNTAEENLSTNEVPNGTELVVDRYAMIDAGKFDELEIKATVIESAVTESTVREASVVETELSEETEVETTASNDEIYALLKEPSSETVQEITPTIIEDDVALGAISLSQENPVGNEIVNALEELTSNLPENHLAFKFEQKSSKSA